MIERFNGKDPDCKSCDPDHLMYLLNLSWLSIRNTIPPYGNRVKYKKNEPQICIKHYINDCFLAFMNNTSIN
jgi:hypothetical protein